MTTAIYGQPEVRILDHRFVEFLKPFPFFSDIIGWAEIPTGFICDLESIPLFRGTCPIGGSIHDFICRIGAIPGITKKVAADVYIEFLKFRGTSYIKRYGKYWVVRGYWGYFHKFNVLDDPRS